MDPYVEVLLWAVLCVGVTVSGWAVLMLLGTWMNRRRRRSEDDYLESVLRDMRARVRESREEARRR